MSAMTGALTGRDMKCLDSKALPQSPVRPNLLRSAPKTPSSPRQTRIMRTPSPPVFHLSTMDSVKNSESTSIAVRATSRTTSATYSTNRTGTLDSIANTKQLSSNHHLNRLCGSSVKGGTVLSSHLRSTQATPSLHFKSTSTISTSSMHLSNMAPSSVQKSVCLSSGRFAPSSSVSPPSEIPLCKILPPEWVNKLKLIQNSNKAEEVEDEEEDEVNHQLDQDDDEEDDNMVYRISEEDENDSDLNGQPAHDCTIGTLTDRHHPPVQPRSTVDEQKTLSVPKSVQKSDSCCKIPKVKHGINLLRKVINKPLSKTISEEAIGYRSTSNFATSSSSSVAKIDAGVAATSNNSNHPNLVEKYRKIINLNEANKDRHKEPDRLRQAKSEPDLHSMDLSSAVSSFEMFITSVHFV